MAPIIRTCSLVAALLAATPAQADVPDALAAYVRARAADADGRSDVAAADYARALAAAPGNPVVAARAYLEALASGDMALARRAVAPMQAAGVAPGDTALVALADAVAAKRWDAAQAAVDRLAGGTLDFLAPSIRAWIAHGRGAADPEAPVADGGGNPIGRRFAGETRALLAIADGRVDAGLAQIRAILIANAGNLEFRLAAAELLAGKGRRGDGEALLAGTDPAIVALRAGLRKRKAGAAWGVARLFDRLARDIADGEAATLAIVLARSALVLDPKDDRARLILADVLSRSGDAPRALAVLDAVDRRGPGATAARSLRVSVLNRAGDTDAAVSAATALSQARQATAADAQRLGDLLNAAGRSEQAAAAYTTAIARAGPDAGWTLYLQQGGALDQAGRWDEARVALARAVALAPQEALALNYLGYAKLERGEDVAEARTLIERAARLQPDDPNIADSLGWAYYLTGQVRKGTDILERAARGAPGDTTINEHLGDAYWTLGRRYEARYAWRAAAVGAGAPDAARLSAKIASGPAAGRSRD